MLGYRIQEVSTVIGRISICHCLCLLPKARHGLFLINLLKKKVSLQAFTHNLMLSPTRFSFQQWCLPFQLQFLSEDVKLLVAFTVLQRRSSSPEWSKTDRLMNTLQFYQDTWGKMAWYMQPKIGRFVLWRIKGKVLSVEVDWQLGTLTEIQ